MDLNQPPETPPLVVKLDLSANKAGPVILGMLAKLLQDNGAVIVNPPEDFHLYNKSVRLAGLKVVLGDTTWVRDQQTDKWLKGANAPDLVLVPPA